MLLNYEINPSIIRILKKEKFDVVIFGGYTSLTVKLAIIYCKITKTPLIMWSGSTLRDEAIGIRNIFLPLIKTILRLSDAYVVYGTWAKDYILSFGINPEKIFIAINMGDVDSFLEESIKLKGKKEAIKRDLGLERKYNIIYAGQLIKSRKGVEYLLDAFIKLKQEYYDVGLIIAGEGPQKEELIAQSKNTSDVNFVGFVQPKKLPAYFLAADIFVLPSFFDRFAIVISEAMAAGLPVIATDTNAASIDIIKNGLNGYVVKGHDSNEIYKKLKKLLKNPDKIREMGKNSQEMIKNDFNQDKTLQGFLDAINYVLNKP
ncbi:MAG: glycosyltransferase [Methanobacterium sp. Maddingley MBC34]|nr:MAG: glycosyltransferase [Methanobacterium sp. Maddingley MBC34]